MNTEYSELMDLSASGFASLLTPKSRYAKISIPPYDNKSCTVVGWTREFNLLSNAVKNLKIQNRPFIITHKKRGVGPLGDEEQRTIQWGAH